MSLQQALDDCLIDFDRRVLVTDLLEEYKLTYKEAHDALEAHIRVQERSSANKYEKRFLVHGLQTAGDGDGAAEARELFKIVQGEDKLKEWLGKLKNSQSQLYSVEIAGGSKSAAPIFKPMQQVEVKLAKLEHRAGAKPTSNGVANGMAKTASKPVSTKVEPKAETSEVSKKTSPSEQKAKGKAAATATAAAAKKGSINSFFSAAPAAKAQPPKEAKPAASSSNSMENFFKKQPAAKKSPPTESVKKELPAASNTSVQLFDVESESSDEEEKLDKLRRKVVGSGDESDEADVKPASSKRRRISDSEDEEQPQKKSTEPQKMKQKDAEKKPQQEVDDEAMDVDAKAEEAEVATNETFLDDDGFVITVRPKKQMHKPAKKKTSPKADAAETSAASVSSTKKKSPTAAAGKSIKETPKTKQGNIMSFFSKKWLHPVGCLHGFSILELMLLVHVSRLQLNYKTCISTGKTYLEITWQIMVKILGDLKVFLLPSYTNCFINAFETWFKMVL